MTSRCESEHADYCVKKKRVRVGDKYSNLKAVYQHRVMDIAPCIQGCLLYPVGIKHVTLEERPRIMKPHQSMCMYVQYVCQCKMAADIPASVSHLFGVKL